MFLKEFSTLRPNPAYILTKNIVNPPFLYGNGWLVNSPVEFPISSLVLGFHCVPGDQLTHSIAFNNLWFCKLKNNALRGNIPIPFVSLGTTWCLWRAFQTIRVKLILVFRAISSIWLFERRMLFYLLLFLLSSLPELKAGIEFHHWICACIILLNGVGFLSLRIYVETVKLANYFEYGTDWKLRFLSLRTSDFVLWVFRFMCVKLTGKPTGAGTWVPLESCIGGKGQLNSKTGFL